MAPRLGSSSTRPSAASILMASRSGVRETFSTSAQFAFVELGAGRDAAFDQHLAQAMRHLLVQGGAGNGDDSAVMRVFCMQKIADVKRSSIGIVRA